MKPRSFRVHEIPPVGWERFGPLGGYAPHLHGTLVRLLWLALHPQAGFSRLPHGWAHNRFALPVTIACGARAAEIRRALDTSSGDSRRHSRLGCWPPSDANLPAFERAAILADLEEIESFAASYRNGKPTNNQLALL